MRFGKLQIHQIHDGSIPAPEEVFCVNDQEGKLCLERGILWPVNVYVIVQQDHVILIDAGCGGQFPPSCGLLLEGLKRTGLTPEDITDVFVTHSHPDHIGGLMKEDRIAFSAARVHISNLEVKWLEQLRGSPSLTSIAFQTMQAAEQCLKPYMLEDRVVVFHPGLDELFGAQTVLLPGHTPGMAGLSFREDGHQLLFCGDLFNDTRQVHNPSSATIFDIEPRIAGATRRVTLEGLADMPHSLLATHQTIEGFLSVRSFGQGFKLVPSTSRQLP